MNFNGIPLLFAAPGGPLSHAVYWMTWLSLLLSTTIFLSKNIWPNFPYFLAMTVLMSCHGLMALIVSRGNLLWMFRYFLVFILIFGTTAVWAVFDGSVKVAPFGLDYQTAEYTRILVHSGFLSLCGSLLGWVLALRTISPFKQYPIFISPVIRSYIFSAGLVVAIGFCLLYVFKNGGLLLGGYTYTSRVRDLGFVFGVFNIFHFIGIALLLLSALRPERLQSSILFLSIVTLVLGVLTGSRADFLPQAFLLCMLVFNPYFLRALEKRQFFRLIASTLVLVIFLYFGYVVASWIAIWRSGESVARAVEILFGDGADRLFISNVYGHPMLYFETGNMMLGGLYAAIVNVQEGITGFLWGESYFKYLLTAPPAFLELPRPLGLEWSAFIGDIQMAQGGIFEVAESYWNFGFVGCFVVSFVLSYFFGWLLRKGMLKNNYFYLTWYIVFGLHSFRSIWYQNFSYFRLLTIMLLIYIVGRLFAQWYTSHRTLVFN